MLLFAFVSPFKERERASICFGFESDLVTPANDITPLKIALSAADKLGKFN